MELMVSRRLWLGLTASLALGFLLAILFVPWANLLVQPANPNIHKSPVSSLNRSDTSLLDRSPSGQPDSVIRACDHTSNGDKSAGRAFEGSRNVVDTVHDANGDGGGCSDEYAGGNRGAHDACNSHNPIGGCGFQSEHGS